MKGRTCFPQALLLIAIFAGSCLQACEAGFAAQWGLSFYAQDLDGSSQGEVKVNSLLYKEDEEEVYVAGDFTQRISLIDNSSIFTELSTDSPYDSEPAGYLIKSSASTSQVMAVVDGKATNDCPVTQTRAVLANNTGDKWVWIAFILECDEAVVAYESGGSLSEYNFSGSVSSGGSTKNTAQIAFIIMNFSVNSGESAVKNNNDLFIPFLRDSTQMLITQGLDSSSSLNNDFGLWAGFDGVSDYTGVNRSIWLYQITDNVELKNIINETGTETMQLRGLDSAPNQDDFVVAAFSASKPDSSSVDSQISCADSSFTISHPGAVLLFARNNFSSECMLVKADFSGIWPMDVAVDKATADFLVVAGYVVGSVDFGLGEHTRPSSVQNAFIVKVEITDSPLLGSVVDSLVTDVGNDANDETAFISSVSVDANGMVSASGFYRSNDGQITIDGLPLGPVASTDIGFIVSLSAEDTTMAVQHHSVYAADLSPSVSITTPSESNQDPILAGTESNSSLSVTIGGKEVGVAEESQWAYLYHLNAIGWKPGSPQGKPLTTPYANRLHSHRPWLDLDNVNFLEDELRGNISLLEDTSAYSAVDIVHVEFSTGVDVVHYIAKDADASEPSSSEIKTDGISKSLPASEPNSADVFVKDLDPTKSYAIWLVGENTVSETVTDVRQVTFAALTDFPIVPQLDFDPDTVTLLEGDMANYNISVSESPRTMFFDLVIEVDDVKDKVSIGEETSGTYSNKTTVSFARNALNEYNLYSVIAVKATEDAFVEGTLDGLLIPLAHSIKGSLAQTELTVAVQNLHDPGLQVSDNTGTCQPCNLPEDWPITISINKGDSVDLSVKLSAGSRSDVTIEFSLPGSNSDLATLSQDAMTFTESNWNDPQTITISSVDTNALLGNKNVSIEFFVSSDNVFYSCDYFENAGLCGTLTLEIAETLSAGVSIEGTDPLEVTAGEKEPAKFNLSLSAKPQTAVTVDLMSADPRLVPFPSVLEFGPTIWDQNREIEVHRLQSSNYTAFPQSGAEITFKFTSVDDNFDGATDVAITVDVLAPGRSGSIHASAVTSYHTMMLPEGILKETRIKAWPFSALESPETLVNPVVTSVLSAEAIKDDSGSADMYLQQIKENLNAGVWLADIELLDGIEVSTLRNLSIEQNMPRRAGLVKTHMALEKLSDGTQISPFDADFYFGFPFASSTETLFPYAPVGSLGFAGWSGTFVFNVSSNSAATSFFVRLPWQPYGEVSVQISPCGTVASKGGGAVEVIVQEPSTDCKVARNDGDIQWDQEIEVMVNETNEISFPESLWINVTTSSSTDAYFDAMSDSVELLHLLDAEKFNIWNVDLSNSPNLDLDNKAINLTVHSDESKEASIEFGRDWKLADAHVEQAQIRRSSFFSLQSDVTIPQVDVSLVAAIGTSSDEAELLHMPETLHILKMDNAQGANTQETIWTPLETSREWLQDGTDNVKLVASMVDSSAVFFMGAQLLTRFRVSPSTNIIVSAEEWDPIGLSIFVNSDAKDPQFSYVAVQIHGASRSEALSLESLDVSTPDEIAGSMDFVQYEFDPSHQRLVFTSAGSENAMNFTTVEESLQMVKFKYFSNVASTSANVVLTISVEAREQGRLEMLEPHALSIAMETAPTILLQKQPLEVQLGSSALPIDPELGIETRYSQLQSAVVQVNPFGTLANGTELLKLSEEGMSQEEKAVRIHYEEGTYHLTGVASVGTYESLLRRIVYKASTGESKPDLSDRNAMFQVTPAYQGLPATNERSIKLKQGKVEYTLSAVGDQVTLKESEEVTTRWALIPKGDDALLKLFCKPKLGEVSYDKVATGTWDVEYDQQETLQADTRADLIGFLAEAPDGSWRSNLAYLSFDITGIDNPPHVQDMTVQAFACDPASVSQCPVKEITIPVSTDGAEVESVKIVKEPSRKEFLRLDDKVTAGPGSVRETRSTTVKYLATPGSTAAEKGSDQFRVRVKDTNGKFSNIATVSLSVRTLGSGAAAPTAIDQTEETTTNTPIDFQLNVNTPAGVESVSIFNSGSSSSVQADGTMVTYTPPLNFHGVDTFRYNIKDGLGRSLKQLGEVRVNIEQSNVAPFPGCIADRSKLLTATQEQSARKRQDELQQVVGALDGWENGLSEADDRAPPASMVRTFLSCGGNISVKGAIRDWSQGESSNNQTLSSESAVTILLWAYDVDSPNGLEYSITAMPANGSLWQARITSGARGESSPAKFEAIKELTGNEFFEPDGFESPAALVLYVPTKGDDSVMPRGKDSFRWQARDPVSPSPQKQMDGDEQVHLSLICGPGERMRSETECVVCPSGSFSKPDETDQAACFAVPKGFEGPRRGLTSGTSFPCGNGTYGPEEGLVECNQCPSFESGVTTKLAAVSRLECECEVGYYNAAGQDEMLECRECGENMVCDKRNQSVPLPRNGWLIVPTSGDDNAGPQAVKCLPPASCREIDSVPTANVSVAAHMLDEEATLLGNLCKEGYTGQTCRECESGYYRQWKEGMGHCEQCVDPSGWRMALLAIALVIVAVLFVLVARSGAAGGTLNELVIFMQLLSSLRKVGYDWPSPVQKSLKIFALFNLDLSLFFTPSCDSDLSFAARVYLMAAGPLMIASFVLVVGFVTKAYLWLMPARLGGGDRRRRYELDETARRRRSSSLEAGPERNNSPADGYQSSVSIEAYPGTFDDKRKHTSKWDTFKDFLLAPVFGASDGHKSDKASILMPTITLFLMWGYAPILDANVLVFNCDTEESVFRLDPSLGCPPEGGVRIAAIIAAVVYGLGMPVAIYMICRRYRPLVLKERAGAHRLSDEELEQVQLAKRNFASLVWSYREGMGYHELFNVTRKILILVLANVPLRTEEQVFLLGLFLAGLVGAFASMRPYRHRWKNYLGCLIQAAMLLATALCGTAFFTRVLEGSQRRTLGVITMVILWLSVLIGTIGSLIELFPQLVSGIRRRYRDWKIRRKRQRGLAKGSSARENWCRAMRAAETNLSGSRLVALRQAKTLMFWEDPIREALSKQKGDAPEAAKRAISRLAKARLLGTASPAGVLPPTVVASDSRSGIGEWAAFEERDELVRAWIAFCTLVSEDSKPSHRQQDSGLYNDQLGSESRN